MTTIELKYNFHKLIDNIDNENVLAKFYDILSRIDNPNEGVLWSRLSKDEQDELIIIERESRNPQNLISDSDMINKHSKWL